MKRISLALGFGFGFALALALTVSISACSSSTQPSTANSALQITPPSPAQTPSTCRSLVSTQGYAQSNLVSRAVDVHSTLDSKYQKFIVKFKDQSSGTRTLVPSGHSIQTYKVQGVDAVQVADNAYALNLTMSRTERQKYINELNKKLDVEFIEPDYPIAQSLATANSIANQWALKSVNALAAWNITLGAPIVVAVLDSGIDYTHPDLKGNIWTNTKEVLNGIDDDQNGYIDDIYGWNFADNNASPLGTSSAPHGTHVAGIIAATGENNTGIYGIAPAVKLMSLKFINDTGSGSTSNAIRGINYAIQQKVFAINNSWGSTSSSVALQQAIARAEAAGILFVVAAGNGDASGNGVDISTQPWYPAAYTNSNVMAVAASNAKDQLTPYSNYSASTVKVAAPGDQILSTFPNNSYAILSGTSMATPMATGISALVKSINRNLTAQEVVSIVMGSVDRISDMSGKIESGGRVNAFKAVSASYASLNTSCP
jgi:subtilisin family serine protease